VAEILEDFDDTIEEYNEELAREEGAKFDEKAKLDPRLEPNPFGSGEGNPSRANRAAAHVVDFTQDDELPMPTVPDNTEMVLIQDYAGRIKVWHYNNLQVVQAMAQNMKGKKRLFTVVGGQPELQEINAMGDKINRG